MNVKFLTLLKGFTFYLVFLNTAFAQVPQNSDSLVAMFVKTIKFSGIDSLIEVNGINKTYFNNSQTLLTLAIAHSNLSLVKYLVNKGADVNIVLNTITPLIQCSLYDKDTIADFLLANGAKVDLYNIQKNTPLLYAARLGSINTLKVLIRYRANPFFQNFQNYNSLEYALTFGKNEVAGILSQYMVAYSKGIYPTCYDGPHVERLSKRKAKVFYLVNDSTSSRVYVTSKKFKITNGTLKFHGFFSNDTLEYTVNYRNDIKPEKNAYYHVPNTKIFAVGDVHGDYDSLLKLLTNNSIIDKNLNWTFENGHLVFIGDLLDRGERVTDVLWLVNRLALQAEAVKGKVHVLMGNHETIILNNDNRYINEKYHILTRGNNISYSTLFDRNIWPGGIIRNFKTAIVIDSILFVHAGISANVAQSKLSIEYMNRIVQFLYNPEIPFQISTEQFLTDINLLYSETGIFWYRGYLLQLPNIPRATQEELQNILKTYGAHKMVIGHTEVDSISPIYNGKLIPINVPFTRKGVIPQGLLIDNQRRFWSCTINGDCHLIEK